MRGGKEGEGDTACQTPPILPSHHAEEGTVISPPPFYRWGKLRFPRSNMPEVRLLVSAGI